LTNHFVLDRISEGFVFSKQERAMHKLKFGRCGIFYTVYYDEVISGSEIRSLVLIEKIGTNEWEVTNTCKTYKTLKEARQAGKDYLNEVI
jgi:hypothetical protein